MRILEGGKLGAERGRDTEEEKVAPEAREEEVVEGEEERKKGSRVDPERVAVR